LIYKRPNANYQAEVRGGYLKAPFLSLAVIFTFSSINFRNKNEKKRERKRAKEKTREHCCLDFRGEVNGLGGFEQGAMRMTDGFGLFSLAEIQNLLHNFETH